MKRPLLASILALAALLLQPSQAHAAAFEPFGNGVLYRITGFDPPEARRVCMTATGSSLTSRGRLVVNKLIRPNGFCTSAGFIVVPWVEWAEPQAGFHTITFTARSEATGAVMAVYTLGVFLPATPLPSAAPHVRAWLGNASPAPGAGIELPATAVVPLGSVVTFETVSDSGETLGSRFSLGAATVESGVGRGALFPDRVVLEYDAEGLHRKAFQAVHRGEVTLTVTPDDASIPPGTIKIKVVNPSALGTTHNEFDEAIYRVAHRWGAPPQFIKAHARKESGNFNRTAYRYEPIGAWIGDVVTVSRGQNRRVIKPYSLYRLATKKDDLNEPLAAGADLVALDRDPRNRLLIGCDQNGANGRPMVPGDVHVEAWEIFRCNEVAQRMRWTVKAGAEAAARIAEMKAHRFTAQTGLASSYGLLQMTYVRAIDLRWTGSLSGARNPSLLFDTEENLKQRGGSLDIGTFDVVNVTRTCMTLGHAFPRRYGDLIGIFMNGWHAYNPGEENYELDVAGFIPQFEPRTTTPVIVGGVQ